MTQQTHPAQDLTEATQAGFWQPFRFGSDAESTSVDLCRALRSMLIGGAPRTGATSAARLVALAAALDPHVRLLVFDAKGGRDWQPFERVAHRHGHGVRREATEDLATCLAGLVDELNRRYETLRELPDDACPEGRLTPALACDGALGMPLVVVVVDGVGRYLGHPELGCAIADRLVELARVGPAVGVSLVLVAQRAHDELPLRLRDAMAVRFALPTLSWLESETILGAGARAAGLDASLLPRANKGVGILRDDAGAGRIVQSDFFELACVRRITERSRQLRAGAGTLTGAAAGTTP